MKQIISKIKNKKVLVIGDIIVDRYFHGKCDRISPESPVPVVHVNETKDVLGGAANVAANIKALGGAPVLFGVVGDDQKAYTVKKLLDKQKISHFLIKDPKRCTTVKTRVFGRGQQIVRADFEDKHLIGKTVEKKLFRLLNEQCDKDVIIISDYGKGVVTEALMDFVKAHGTVLIDPIPDNTTWYNHAYLITPNRKEASLMLGKSISDSSIEQDAQRLFEQLHTNILITVGEKGMVLYTNDGFSTIPTASKEVYDVCGAGDTVIATIALAVAAGSSLQDACELSNIAAGVVVGKRGTATVSPEELLKEYCTDHSKIKSIEEIEQICQNLREHKQIVFTNGCFDLIHTGHIDVLKRSKNRGDLLIVGLNSDASVQALKGPRRPIIAERERAEILASFDFVDYVVIFEELDPRATIAKVKPHIHIKGEDYKNKKIIEEATVRKYGGEIIYLPFLKDRSTTSIIEKIRNGDIIE